MMLKFRPLTPGDFPLLLEWLAKEHVKEWWNDGDDTLEKVASHYAEEEEGLGRFMLIASDENLEKPIGYFQHYTVPGGSMGIDQFIGEEDYLNRGIGTLAIQMFVEMLVRAYQPNAIILDPSPENKRAIKCYEKVGFSYCETKQNAEGGLAYLMRLECRRTVG
jgi:RimJ/RimL family protein N-acetyltransferase